MIFTLPALLLMLALIAGMLLSLEAGRRIRFRRAAVDPTVQDEGFGAVEGAVFGLLGLLLAFTFSGAATRFDTRRELIVQEANAIGTAYLRIDLLPAETQPALRESFRQYLDSRLAVYRKLPDIRAARKELDHSIELQQQIWSQAVAACKEATIPTAAMLLLPALNEMIDITTVRTVAARTHPPTLIYTLLAGLALIGALLAGYGMAGGRRRSWVHILAFACIMAAAIYITIDLEFPRAGIIRIDSFDQVLVEVRDSMK